MYCQQCGSLLPKGAAFCPSCGAPTNTRNPAKAPGVDNKTQLQEAEKAVQSAWESYCAWKAAVKERENSLSERRSSRTYSLYGIIGSAVILFLSAMMLHIMLDKTSDWITLGTRIGFGVVLSVMLVVTLWMSVHNIKKYRRLNRQLPSLERVQARKEADFRALLQSKSIEEGLTLAKERMPAECLHPAYARVFIDYLESGRADTLREAQHRFDDYLYREPMESAVREQLDEIYRMHEALNQK